MHEYKAVPMVENLLYLLGLPIFVVFLNFIKDDYVAIFSESLILWSLFSMFIVIVGALVLFYFMEVFERSYSLEKNGLRVNYYPPFPKKLIGYSSIKDYGQYVSLYSSFHPKSEYVDDIVYVNRGICEYYLRPEDAEAFYLELRKKLAG